MHNTIVMHITTIIYITTVIYHSYDYHNGRVSTIIYYDDNILIMKESLNSDGQQFQQNEQLPLILTH
jgi:hypothetical protein